MTGNGVSLENAVLKWIVKPGVEVIRLQFSPSDAKAGRLWVPGQTQLHSEAVPQKK